jgi:hypothetical protein
MAINLFGGLPWITESPAEGMYKAAQLGLGTGQLFGQSLAAGQRARQEREELGARTEQAEARLGEEQRQFNLLGGLRAAQMAQAQAQVDSFKAKTALDTFTARTQANWETGNAEAMGFSAGLEDYGPQSEKAFWQFMKTHPQMVGSPWEKQMQSNFDAAKNYENKLELRKAQEEAIAARAETARVREATKAGAELQSDIIREAERLRTENLGLSEEESIDRALKNRGLAAAPRFESDDELLAWAKKAAPGAVAFGWTEIAKSDEAGKVLIDPKTGKPTIEMRRRPVTKEQVLQRLEPREGSRGVSGTWEVGEGEPVSFMQRPIVPRALARGQVTVGGFNVSEPYQEIRGAVETGRSTLRSLRRAGGVIRRSLLGD